MQMNRKAGVGVVLGAALVVMGCATGPKPLPSFTETNTESVTATVVAVDQASRLVTVKGEKGETFEFVAGDQVQNLAQVQAGDQIKIDYVESLAVEVRRDGSQPDLQVAAAGGRAEPGQKPAGAIGAAVTVSATIEAIDRNTNRVTLKGPQGNYRVVKVRDPKKLENVKVGDVLYITYTEALGIKVEKVAPAAPAAK